MMRKKFCCDASRGLYEDYYMNQSENGVNVFQGSRGQRGHGLGSMLSGLFRSAMPMLKRGLAIFGRHALRTGAEIANDVADGESLGNSARRRVSEGIKRINPSEFFIPQTGSGRKRRRVTSRKQANRKLKSKKRKRGDIFD